MVSNSKLILEKVKKVLPQIICDYNIFNLSKKEFYKIAVSVDVMRTPEVPTDTGSFRVNYLKDIFNAFDESQILEFVSLLIKRNYETVQRFVKSGYSKSDDFKRSHEKFITELNKVLSYMEVNISLDGKIENFPIGKVKEKIYPAHEPYDFYKDLKDLVKTTKNELFIVDAYVNEELLDLYIEKVPDTVNIRILTKSISGNFITVAGKFAKKPGIKFEVRKSLTCHDRVIFIDDSCFVIGQSIKDAATKKPTYLFQLDNKEMKRVYEEMWESASTITLP